MIFVSLPSCNQEESIQSSDNNSNLTLRWKIYHVEWDEWGRKSRNCGSWGLCNFQDCWFCDPIAGSGDLNLNESTGVGTLTIELSSPKF